MQRSLTGHEVISEVPYVLFLPTIKLETVRIPCVFLSFSLPIIMSYLISSGVPINHAIKVDMIPRLNSFQA